LSRYDLVILPNTANVSDVFCSAVFDYVRSGGRVLGVGETSLFDEKGFKRPDFGMKDLLGVSSKGSIEGNFAIERPTGPEPATGILQQVIPSGKAVSRHIAVDPAGSVAGARDPFPIKPTEWPVVVTNACGKGQSLYIAFDVGQLHGNHNLPHIASFMADMVDSVLPSRQMKVKAPRSVEVTMFRQEADQRTIIHLADRTQSASDMTKVTEIVPVHDVEIVLKTPCVNPKVTCRGSQVMSAVDGDRLRINVSKVESYAAIVIEPKFG
jgi:hypothetical protein